VYVSPTLHLLFLSDLQVSNRVLRSSLDGGEWTMPLYSSERAVLIILKEAGWAPKPSLDGCGKGKLSWLHRRSNPEPSSPWPVAAPTNLSRPNSTNKES